MIYHNYSQGNRFVSFPNYGCAEYVFEGQQNG
jgi:hypothetical protein